MDGSNFEVDLLVDEVVKEFKKQMAKALYQKYLEYEKELLRVGSEMIAEMVKNLPREDVSLPDCRRTGNALNLTGHRVISESDLRRARGSASSTVLIDRGAIVTPLARDFIANQNLVIQRE